MQALLARDDTDVKSFIRPLRERAENLHHQISTFHNNLYNQISNFRPVDSWTDIFTQFSLISASLVALNLEIDKRRSDADVSPFLKNWAVFPKTLHGGDPNFVPNLLRTKPLPEVDSAFQEVRSEYLQTAQPDAEESVDAHIEIFNANMRDAADIFDVLKEELAPPIPRAIIKPADADALARPVMPFAQAMQNGTRLRQPHSVEAQAQKRKAEELLAQDPKRAKLNPNARPGSSGSLPGVATVGRK